MLFGNLIMFCRQKLCFSAWLKNHGSRVREIQIQWHKSKETPRIDPENTGEQKKNNFFGFPWGFCMYFFENQTRMNFSGNRMGDGFSWESNGGFAKRKNREQKKKKSNIFGFPWGFCMDFLGNQTRMNFPGNRMGYGFSWESNGGFAKRKHKE